MSTAMAPTRLLWKSCRDCIDWPKFRTHVASAPRKLTTKNSSSSPEPGGPKIKSRGVCRSLTISVRLSAGLEGAPPVFPAPVPFVSLEGPPTSGAAGLAPPPPPSPQAVRSAQARMRMRTRIVIMMDVLQIRHPTWRYCDGAAGLVRGSHRLDGRMPAMDSAFDWLSAGQMRIRRSWRCR